MGEVASSFKLLFPSVSTISATTITTHPLLVHNPEGSVLIAMSSLRNSCIPIVVERLVVCLRTLIECEYVDCD